MNLMFKNKNLLLITLIFLGFVSCKAQNVDILFTLRDHLFTMEIIDDGVGLGENLTSGNGLNNMQRRIQNLCGLFVIKPSEKGLHLVFEIKL